MKGIFKTLSYAFHGSCTDIKTCFSRIFFQKCNKPIVKWYKPHGAIQIAKISAPKRRPKKLLAQKDTLCAAQNRLGIVQSRRLLTASQADKNFRNPRQENARLSSAISLLAISACAHNAKCPLRTPLFFPTKPGREWDCHGTQ